MRTRLREAWVRLRGGDLSPERAAASVALGVFIGFVPLYGVQTFFCLAIALPLRLDFPVVWASTNLANPLTAPFIVVLEIELGAYLTTGAWISVSRADFQLAKLGAFLGYAMLGGALLGGASALVAYLSTLGWMRRRRRRRAHSTMRTPST
ncbi:MAG TPA: DUF2062 domain-containing protein [Polyangiaceae bacterium]|nr:DUF2062 domain-containing protein [Polyangiaceae bacterium]